MTDYYDPYGPDASKGDSSTPPLDEILRHAIETDLLRLHTWMPAQITRVRSNGLVDVQPLLQKKYRAGKVVSLPIVQSIPVEHPRGSDWWVKLPIAVGGYGRISFCERSLDAWSVQGGIVDPKDTRHHDLSDGIFIPGLYPNNSIIPGAAADMILRNGPAELHVQKAGTFKVKNAENELLSVLSDLVNTLMTETYTLTMMGPEPFIASTNSLLSAIKDKIDSLKGT